MKQIADCPRCKEKAGFFTRIQQSYRLYYLPNGEVHGTDDGVNDLRSGRGGSRRYCAKCNKDITAQTG